MPQILGPITPTGNFPAMQDVYLAGGYRVVSDVAERDSIPLERRVSGMVVHTKSDGKTWRLNPDLSGWTEIQFGTAVTSVFGRTGAVTAETGDYSMSQIGGSLDAQRIADGTVTNAEFQRLAGVTGNIQAQINNLAPTAHTHPWSTVDQSGAGMGQVPVWNGTQWVPQTPAVGQPFPEIEIVSYAKAYEGGGNYSAGLLYFGESWWPTGNVSWTAERYLGMPCITQWVWTSKTGGIQHNGNESDFSNVKSILFVFAISDIDPSNSNIICGMYQYSSSDQPFPDPDPPSSLNGIGFRFASNGNWQLMMQRADGQRWTYDTSVAATSNAFNRLVIKKNTLGMYEFYVNRVLVGDTASAPSNAYPEPTAILRPCIGYKRYSGGSYLYVAFGEYRMTI